MAITRRGLLAGALGGAFAPRLAGWQRLARNLPGPLQGASLAGQPFLTDVFGPNARIAVEAAFAADLTASSDTWPWIDVTADVRQADGQRISISPMGRSDETSASQPAGCSFELDNAAGNYSTGPASKWFPYIRRNTPIRVRLTLDGSSWSTRFQGYANGFTPSWDASANLAVVTVSASGVLRRLGRRTAPAVSDMYREATSPSASNVIGYWPMEDGAGADSVAEVKAGGGSNMLINGDFGFAESDMTTLPGSNALAKPATGSYGIAHSPIFPNDWTTADGWNISWVMKIPRQPSSAEVILLEMWAGDNSARRWQVALTTAGNIVTRCYNQAGTELLSDAGNGFDQYPDGTGYAYNRWIFFSLIWSEFPAGSALVQTSWYTLTSTGQQYQLAKSNVLSGHLPTYPYEIRTIAGPTSSDEFGIGHIVLQKGFAPFLSLYTGLGHPGEGMMTRLRRLCASGDIPLTIIGSSSTLMGAQSSNKLLDAIRECETADDGVLYDGLGAGLVYVTRSARCNAATALTADMSTDPPQVATPFVPVDDDQRTRNLVKVSRKNGSSASYEDITGVLGTAAIGTYDSSLTINTKTDDDLVNRAAHEVKKGTVADLRYPSLNLDLAAVPALAPGWLAASVASRLAVTNVTSRAAQHPPGDVDLTLEGWSEQLGPYDWRVTGNCSPFSPWRVGVIEGAGDTTWRLDSGGSALAAVALPGDTSLSVSVTDGKLWSTSAADYPRTVDVGGVPVVVSAVSGASSPQTFTVTALTYRLEAGWTVKLWHPATLAL